MSYIVYVKEGCTYCTQAKSLLKMRGEAFTSVLIESDFEREELKRMFPKATSFPVVIKDGKFIGGYTELRESYENQGPGLLMESH